MDCPHLSILRIIFKNTYYKFQNQNVIHGFYSTTSESNTCKYPHHLETLNIHIYSYTNSTVLNQELLDL